MLAYAHNVLAAAQATIAVDPIQRIPMTMHALAGVRPILTAALDSAHTITRLELKQLTLPIVPDP